MFPLQTTFSVHSSVVDVFSPFYPCDPTRIEAANQVECVFTPDLYAAGLWLLFWKCLWSPDDANRSWNFCKKTIGIFFGSKMYFCIKKKILELSFAPPWKCLNSVTTCIPKQPYISVKPNVFTQLCCQMSELMFKQNNLTFSVERDLPPSPSASSIWGAMWTFISEQSSISVDTPQEE